jgi:hypothetical protein
MRIDKADYHMPGVENEENIDSEDKFKLAVTHMVCFMVWAGSKNLIKDDKLKSYLAPIVSKGLGLDLLLETGANYLDSDDFDESLSKIFKKYPKYLGEYGKQLAKIKKQFYVPYSQDIQVIANQILDNLEKEISSKKSWEFWK